MRKASILAGAVSVLCLLTAPPAPAQEYPYSPGNYTYTVIQGSQAMDNLRLSQMMARRRAGGTPRRAAAPASMTFRPVSAALLPSRLAAAAARGEAERREAERFFNQLLDAYKASARQKGIAPNDVARAASFMLISTYEVYNDNRRLSEPQREALRRQMREFLSQQDEFRQAGDRERQEMFESCVIVGMFLGSAYDGARQKGDREAMSNLREAARQQLEETLEMPVGRVDFTESGIVYR